jgi:dTMP kinase
METKGKFIVIEGIDGCGGETQTNFLSDFLSQKGYNVKLKSYPEYEGPIGQVIHNFLHKKYDFPINTETLMYFADFTKDAEEMHKYLENGIIIADRYFTSTIVYQCLKGFPLDKMLALSEMFNLPKPDLCIYVKISAETSFNRKSKEKGGDFNLDRHEENKKFLKIVAEGYEKIAQDNIFCDWAVIDGEKPIEEVSKEILEVINKKLGI